MSTRRRLSLALILFTSCYSQAHTKHTEDTLWQAALKSGAPTLKRIEASFMGAKLASAQQQASYTSILGARIGYQDTNEKPLNPMQPIFTPSSEASIFATKNFTHGLSATVSASANKMSSKELGINNQTKAYAEFSVVMDLWKNLLGRVDKAKIYQRSFEQEKAAALLKIRKKEFQIELRKVYWALIANRESEKYAKQLLNSTKKQLREAEKRLKASVGDKTSVARLRSQVATRQNIITSLHYQKVNMQKALMAMIPSLAGSQIKLARVDVAKTVSLVKQCAKIIKNRPKNPLLDTAYKPLLEAIEKSYRAQSIVAKSTSQMDLKLTMAHARIASENKGSYTTTPLDLPTTPYGRNQLRLEWSMPLFGDMDRLEKRQLALERAIYEAEKGDFVSRLASQKTAIVPHIGLMFEALRNQKKSTGLLSESVKSVEAKYKQARLSLMDLIREQDALQDSQLREVDTNLQVLTTLLDHFKIFTDTPCKINKPLS